MSDEPLKIDSTFGVRLFPLSRDKIFGCPTGEWTRTFASFQYYPGFFFFPSIFNMNSSSRFLITASPTRVERSRFDHVAS